MASKSEPAFDDLDPVNTDEESSGSNWLNPNPGETVSGTITGWNPDAGHNGVIELDGNPMYMNRTLQRQLIAALVEGNQMFVRVDENSQTFTNDDGEETEYHPKEARFARDD
ncbi:hypothetical protein GRX01_06600 [Halobaculum sp. WSA2]|uniref:Uncharacterized protein n=1 Tax=Halobaculum saliterrae TaxID=2073113 RepID=A0A6B0SYG1_9EURY|nr:hypothetical protein [Halobaculum saliterrae]MXR41010.1 hypothetical protein [Halobaculum saliterrae]